MPTYNSAVRGEDLPSEDVSVDRDWPESPAETRTHPSDGWQAGASGLTDHAMADLRGQRSVVVSFRRTSPTSHGLEAA
jgi:hypothetical protein